MSGSNPFRRSILTNASPISQNLGQAETPASAEHFSPPTPALGQENVRAHPGTKTVRIASPPIASQDQQDTSEAGHRDLTGGLSYGLGQSTAVHSSFPLSPEFNEARYVNPFEAEVQEDEEDSEGHEVLNNTRQNSAVPASSHHIVPPRPVDQSQKSPVRGGKPSESGFADADTRRARPTAIRRAGSGPARASLDVDAFKRLIMTGDMGTVVTGAPPTPPAQNLTPQNILGDSSSNTDTSSISRQSLFESMTEAATDTPRTSHEISVSDDERQQLAGTASFATKNPEPQPSKIRYGAPLNSYMPSEVSLADSSTPSTNLENRQYTTNLHVSTANSLSQLPTDLNKPLPLPPSRKQPEEPTNIQQGSFRPDKSSNRLRSTSPSSILPKKRPPTPPLARRHSQLRSSNPVLSRSNSARLPSPSGHGLGSLHDTDVRTPPPPPTRRTLSGRARSSLDTSMLARTVLTGTPSTVAGSTGSEKHQTRPPLPPSRTHSISSPKRPYRPPPAASSVAKVPPVPPPRNRGSSQSSFDSAHVDTLPKLSAAEPGLDFRLSSKDSHQETSEAPTEGSIQMPASMPGTNANDILADLTALQKEVDELRGRYEMRRASE